MATPDGKAPMPERLSLAVLSDLHAYHTAKEPPSHYCVTNPSKDSGKNPIAALLDLSSTDSLRADLLLCAGDLGHQACAIGIQHAWDSLNNIKVALGASKLVATTGNHDIDSRYAGNRFDPKGFLQSLSPSYPLDDESLCDRYWARHFAVLTGPIWRLLVVNSSAFHGGGVAGPDEQPEFSHGRISDHTLNEISKELARQVPAPHFNFLLCHHHPHPHTELNLGANDLMIGGDRLLQLLGSGEHGEWLVIHGHKHHPKLEVAAGSASAPWVFAAGSLCSSLFLEMQTRARNQFYLFDFSTAEFEIHGFVGRFRAWDWHSGLGWIPANDSSGLPAIGGFGWKGKVPQLAKSIMKSIDKMPGTPIDWSALLGSYPDLDFLDPVSLRQLISYLKRQGIICQPTDRFPPLHLGRPV